MNTNEPHLAVLVERIEHIATRFDDLARGVEELRNLVQTVNVLKTDIIYTKENVKQLALLNKHNADNIHKIDKRVIVLERWHKMMLALPAIFLALSISAFSYISGFLTDLSEFKYDTKERIGVVEHFINNGMIRNAPETKKD